MSTRPTGWSAAIIARAGKWKDYDRAGSIDGADHVPELKGRETGNAWVAGAESSTPRRRGHPRCRRVEDSALATPFTDSQPHDVGCPGHRDGPGGGARVADA